MAPAMLLAPGLYPDGAFPNDNFARGAYTIEAFTSVGQVDAAERILLATLGPHEARHVKALHSFGGSA